MGNVANRVERKARMAELKRRVAQYPDQLARIPRDHWPQHMQTGPDAPLDVLASKDWLVQCYPERNEMLRLSINRTTIDADGNWSEGITWEDLMQVKRECGFGEVFAVEVFPRDNDLVNVANMRHLWCFKQPLDIGWFNPKPAEQSNEAANDTPAEPKPVSAYPH